MEITRSELYRLVSDAPLSKVAPKLGLSPTILAATCKKHDIPYPGSGFWTRKAMGLPATPPPMPDSENADAELVMFPQAKPRIAKHKAVTERSSPKKGRVDAEPTAVAPVVKERLSKPHQIVANWLEQRERKRREARTNPNPFFAPRALAPWSELDRRRHRLLDALFKALESRGGAVSDTERGLQCVTIEGEKIEFQIREKLKQLKVPVAEKDRLYYSSGFRQELTGTGRLVFAIKTYLRGPHNEEWLETETRPLEDQLPRIVDRLFEGAEILKAWHLEQEQEREQWRQEAAQRAEQQRLAKEEERWTRFVALAQTWRTNQSVATFIDALEAMPHEPGAQAADKTVHEWLQWAKRRLGEQDPLAQGVADMFARL
jgi:hypothetical protein